MMIRVNGSITIYINKGVESAHPLWLAGRDHTSLYKLTGTEALPPS